MKIKILGMVFGAMLLPFFSGCFVFLKTYSDVGMVKSACDALAVFLGIAVHLLFAAIIVRLVMTEGRKTTPKIAVDVLLIIYGAVMLIMTFSGFDGTFFSFVYDGFLYADTLGFRVFGEYFYLCFTEMLLDLRFLFYWIAVLSVVQMRIRLNMKNFAELCSGGALAVGIIIAACLLIGYTKHWQIVNWYAIPESAELAMCGTFYAGVIVSGVWLMTTHIKSYA